MLTCPYDIVTSDTIVQWDPVTATDNIGIIGEVKCTYASGDTFRLGDTKVECFATDEAGNRGECNFDILVGKCFFF